MGDNQATNSENGRSSEEAERKPVATGLEPEPLETTDGLKRRISGPIPTEQQMDPVLLASNLQASKPTETRRPKSRRGRRAKAQAEPEEPHPHASFARLAEAYFSLMYAQSAEDPPPNLDELRTSLQRTTTEFESKTGPILDSYFGPWIQAAAVLTGSSQQDMSMVWYFFDQSSRSGQEIHRYGPLVMSEDITEAGQLLMRCDDLARRAATTLPAEEGDACISTCYGVVKAVLSLLEERAWRMNRDGITGPIPLGEKAMTTLRGELEQAKTFYEQSLDNAKRAELAAYQQRARAYYLLGMLVVALFVLPIVAGLAYLFFRSRLPITRIEIGTGATAFIAGAAGAVVSVMLRMTAGKLNLQPGLSDSQLVALGAFRPTIGAIFGLSFYFFIRGGLVPIAIPADPTAQLFFFPALGFIAGFSERLAQETIKGAEDALPNVTFPST